MTHSELRNSELQNQEWQKPPCALVVGDSLSAVFAAATLARQGKKVFWVQGTGTRLLPTVSAVASDLDLSQFNRLLEHFDLPALQLISGSWRREFKNKTFRPLESDAAGTDLFESIPWLKEAESLLEPASLAEVDSELRARLREKESVTRLENVSVRKIDLSSSSSAIVTLTSGKQIECDRIVYADRLLPLSRIEGAAAAAQWAAQVSRRSRGVYALQWVATHAVDRTLAFRETFAIPMLKEAGEKDARFFWGYAFENGRKSVWTVILSAEEVEDNHTIMKRIRRIKQGLSKAFDEAMQAQGVTDWASTLVAEQVRFEDEALFESGSAPCEHASFDSNGGAFRGIDVLTDAFGPSSMLRQWESWRFQIDSVAADHGTVSHRQSADTNHAVRA